MGRIRVEVGVVMTYEPDVIKVYNFAENHCDILSGICGHLWSFSEAL